MWIPPEVVAHLPLLCEEEKSLYFVPSKAKIGTAIGIDVPSGFSGYN